MPITIYLGADHGGFPLKEQCKTWLQQQNYVVVDLGAATLDPDDDYPQYAIAVGREVASDSSRRGILFCRSGAGMAIAANKVVGIRAVAAHSVDEVKHAREHDDANVLTIAADWLRAASVEELLRAFLTTEGAVAPRHVRRIQQISEYELSS